MPSAGLDADPSPELPTLLFLIAARSGASRRMASLVAWVKVTQKRKLRVLDIDVDAHPGLVCRLGVIEVPALVLLKDRNVVARLEGRATRREIDDFIRPFLR